MELFKADKINIETHGFITIKNASFTIESGESVIIYSPYNESGILLDALCCKRALSSGCVKYVGQDLSLFTREDLIEWRINDIQYIDSSFSLFKSMDVKSNIYLPLTINRKPIDFKYMEEVITLLNLDDLLDKKSSSLSDFEILKTEIARSLSLKPFVIFLKNVTEELADEERETLMNMLSKINDIYKTTIIHSTSFFRLRKWGSRIIDIDNKTVVESVK